MTDKYFDGDATDLEVEHPRLRLWQAHRKKRGVTGMKMQVLRRRASFGFEPPRLVVDFTNKKGEPVEQDEVPWDWELDTWLLREKVRAIDPRNEALRLSLRLRHAFARLLRAAGDGYFNSLLVHVLQQGPYAEHPSVRPVLEHIHAYAPHESPQLADRSRELDVVLEQHAKALIGPLGYKRADAKEVFANALATYLDERFHVSARRELFGA